MKKLILNNNFDDVEYIIENDTLYFDIKTVACLSDANEETVRRNCKEVLGEYMEHVDFTTNMWKSLYIEKKTGGRPKRFYIHYIVGDVLHRLKSPKAIKFRIWANDKTFRQPVLSLEQEAKETIKILDCKVWEHTKNAFESSTKEEFNYHMDLADKYSMDSMKRRFQLRNELNCSRRLRRELEMNQKGLLTESGENRVFIPDNQSTLFEFNIWLK